MKRLFMILLLILFLCSCASNKTAITNTPYTKHSGKILSIVETENETKKDIKTLYFLTVDEYTPSFNIYPKYERTYVNSSSSQIIGIKENTHIYRKVNDETKETIDISDLKVNQLIEIWVTTNKQNDEFLDTIEITVLSD